MKILLILVLCIPFAWKSNTIIFSLKEVDRAKTKKMLLKKLFFVSHCSCDQNGFD